MEFLERREDAEGAKLAEELAADNKLNEQTQSLDPLNASEFFLHKLPMCNQSGDVKEIEKYAQISSPSEDVIDGYDVAQGRAALRDLGMIAGSLNKHGVKPDSVIPLKTALVLLGEKIDEVPRDTVFSYGPRNPQAEELRSFTGAVAERNFIGSFVAGMKGLTVSVSLLVSARGLPASSADFFVRLNEAATNFSKMTTAVIEAQTKMPQGFFASELRPYFDPFEINGIKYQGPSGSQMPVLVLDNLLWGSDQSIEVYNKYKREGIKYSSPVLRKIFNAYDNKPSIVSKLINEHERGRKLDRESIESVIKLLNQLIDFRGRHKQLADKDFKLRPETAVGSGGYKPEFLQALIDPTVNAKERLDRLLL